MRNTQRDVEEDILDGNVERRDEAVQRTPTKASTTSRAFAAIQSEAQSFVKPLSERRNKDTPPSEE